MEKIEKTNERIAVNIGNYTGEKPIEIVLREGVAPEVQQLELKKPESINVTGVLSTPLDWLTKRVKTIDQKAANIVVNREAMTITLTTNERDAYTKSIFVGKAAFSEIFEAFHINDEEFGWNPARLGQFLRLNRAVFAEKEENMKLVSALKNFTANAKSEIEKQRDPSGSRADVYRTQVESNLPKSFTVNVAIFKGTEKTPIVVEFDHYLTDGEVYLQLVSPGAKEVADEYRDRCIDDVLGKIREIAPDIAIMEA